MMGDYFALALAVLGISSTAFVAISHYRRLIKRRTDQLRAAKVALERHYDAMDMIADDPALPTSALRVLINISDAIHDEKFMTHFFATMRDGGVSKNKQGMPNWAEDMLKLHKSRPDLVEKFDEALSTALIAGVYRWPAPAQAIYEMSTTVASGRRNEAQYVQQLIDVLRPKNGGNPPNSGLPAMC